MAKIYQTDGHIISDGFPQIQLKDKLFRVDTRMSNYERVSKIMEHPPMVKDPESGEEVPKSEIRCILEGFLGQEQADEILGVYEDLDDDGYDLTVSGTQDLIAFIMAAVMDIEFEEAQARFQRAGFSAI